MLTYLVLSLLIVRKARRRLSQMKSLNENLQDANSIQIVAQFFYFCKNSLGSFFQGIAKEGFISNLCLWIKLNIDQIIKIHFQLFMQRDSSSQEQQPEQTYQQGSMQESFQSLNLRQNELLCPHYRNVQSINRRGRTSNSLQPIKDDSKQEEFIGVYYEPYDHNLNSQRSIHFYERNSSQRRAVQFMNGNGHQVRIPPPSSDQNPRQRTVNNCTTYILQSQSSSSFGKKYQKMEQQQERSGQQDSQSESSNNSINMIKQIMQNDINQEEGPGSGSNFSVDRFLVNNQMGHQSPLSSLSFEDEDEINSECSFNCSRSSIGSNKSLKSLSTADGHYQEGQSQVQSFVQVHSFNFSKTNVLLLSQSYDNQLAHNVKGQILTQSRPSTTSLDLGTFKPRLDAMIAKVMRIYSFGPSLPKPLLLVKSKEHLVQPTIQFGQSKCQACQKMRKYFQMEGFQSPSPLFYPTKMSFDRRSSIYTLEEDNSSLNSSLSQLEECYSHHNRLQKFEVRSLPDLKMLRLKDHKDIINLSSWTQIQGVRIMLSDNMPLPPIQTQSNTSLSTIVNLQTEEVQLWSLQRQLLGEEFEQDKSKQQFKQDEKEKKDEKKKKFEDESE